MNQFVFPRRWLTIGGALLLGLLLAAAIRYGILENEAQARACEQGAEAGGWCGLRSVVGWSIYMQLYGVAALLLGLAAWVPRWRSAAFGALFLAGCGLFIYNTTYAAAAFVIGLLAALQPAPKAG